MAPTKSVPKAALAASHCPQSSNIPNQPLRDFHTFAKLCPEIQDLIWEWACVANPSVVSIHINQHTYEYVGALPTVPAILHATSGSRGIALNHFQLIENQPFDREVPQPGGVNFHQNFLGQPQLQPVAAQPGAPVVPPMVFGQQNLIGHQGLNFAGAGPIIAGGPTNAMANAHMTFHAGPTTAPLQVATAGAANPVATLAPAVNLNTNANSSFNPTTTQPANATTLVGAPNQNNHGPVSNLPINQSQGITNQVQGFANQIQVFANQVQVTVNQTQGLVNHIQRATNRARRSAPWALAARPAQKFYLNPNCDIFTLQVGDSDTQYAYPEIRISEDPFVLRPERSATFSEKQNTLGRLSRDWPAAQPQLFPSVGKLPAFFEQLHHVAFAFILPPCPEKLTSHSFKDWVKTNVTSFCDKLVNSTMTRLPDLESCDFVISIGNEFKGVDRMVLKELKSAPVMESNGLTFGASELAEIHYALKEWFFCKYLDGLKAGARLIEPRIVGWVPDCVKRQRY